MRVNAFLKGGVYIRKFHNNQCAVRDSLAFCYFGPCYTAAKVGTKINMNDNCYQQYINNYSYLFKLNYQWF